jgi:hypothetical protein
MATNRPIVPALADYDDGEIDGMMIGRETEVLGENLPQCHFVPPQTSHACLDANPCRRDGKPVTNCLSYGMAYPGMKVTEWSYASTPSYVFMV